MCSTLGFAQQANKLEGTLPTKWWWVMMDRSVKQMKWYTVNIKDYKVRCVCVTPKTSHLQKKSLRRGKSEPKTHLCRSCYIFQPASHWSGRVLYLLRFPKRITRPHWTSGGQWHWFGASGLQVDYWTQWQGWDHHSWQELRGIWTARRARARRRMHEVCQWLKWGGSMQDEHDRAVVKSHALKLDFQIYFIIKLVQ